MMISQRAAVFEKFGHMPQGRRVTRALLFLSLLLLSPTVQAQVPLGITFQGAAAASYDGNIYLQTVALHEDVAAVQAAGLALAPSAELRIGLARSHHLLFSHSTDFQQFLLADGGHESLLQHQAVLSYVTAPLAGFRFTLAAGLDQLVLAQQSGAGWLGVTGGLSASRALCGWARAELEYRVDHTEFGELSSVAWQTGHGPSLSLALRLARGVVLEPFYGVLLQTGATEMEATLHQTGIWLTWRLPWLPLRLRARYQFTVTDISMAHEGETIQQQDRMHTWGEEAHLEARTWLALFVRHTSIIGDDDTGQDYSRHQVLAGVEFVLDWSRAPAASSTSEPRRLVLEYHNPGARSVSVVGSFNSWDPAAGRLQQQGGVWRRSQRLGPGKHVYMLWVDGNMVPPPGCATWIRDGFDGKNCLVEVY